MPGKHVMFPILARHLSRIIPTSYPRLAKIIHSSPNKITNYITMAMHQFPVGKSISWVRFCLDNDTRRNSLMIFRCTFQVIIITGNVKNCHKRIKRWPRLTIFYNSRGNGTGSIHLLYSIRKHFSRFYCFRFSSFYYFVTYAPHDNRGMITISQNHGFKVAFPPFVKIPCIIIFVFPNPPTIKCFIHN